MVFFTYVFVTVIFHCLMSATSADAAQVHGEFPVACNAVQVRSSKADISKYPLVTQTLFPQDKVFAVVENETAVLPNSEIDSEKNDFQLGEDELNGLVAVEQLTYDREEDKYWLLSGQIATVHDSNILIALDTETSQGSSVVTEGKRGGLRLLANADVERRFIYTKKNQLSATYATEYYYSEDSKFAAADPFTHTFQLPYSIKGILGEKNYDWTFRPGYENILMDASNSGLRLSILSSIMFDSKMSLVMGSHWIAAYSINVRRDDSLLAESLGPNDADALKYILSTQQSWFLDDTCHTTVVATFGLVKNDAKGSEKKYQRLELGFKYSGPMAWEMDWSGTLSGYRLIFPDHSSSREDSSLSLTLDFTKPLSSHWKWVTTANYTGNRSSVTDFEYSKYLVSTGARYSWP